MNHIASIWHPYRYWLWPVVICILARLLYHFVLGPPDYWGDAYHNVYISQATVENNWVYSDYKGREVVWLPVYRYLSAIAMYMAGSFSLWTAYVLNTLLAALTCGLLSWLTARYTDTFHGFLAGTVMALLPLHVTFSHMNMEEVLCGLVLVLTLFLIHTGNSKWLLPLCAVGCVIRNELTLLLGLIGFLSLFYRPDGFKTAFYMAAGAVLGLSLWSWWCYANTGEYLSWIFRRVEGSAFDAQFTQADKGLPRNLGSLIWCYPYLAGAPLLYFARKKWPGPPVLQMAFIVTLFLWLFVMVMQVRFFPVVDPRYFLIVTPLATMGLVFYLYQYDSARDRRRKKTIFLPLVMVIYVVLTPPVVLMSVQQLPHRQMGEYIGQNYPPDTAMIIDSPTAWYYSGRNVAATWSTDQAVPPEIRKTEQEVPYALCFIREQQIENVLSFHASYSYTHKFWPEMKQAEVFEWQSLRFSPVKRVEDSAGYNMKPFSDISQTSDRLPLILWEIGKETAH